MVDKRVCSLCGVTIEGDNVTFSRGTGTKKALWDKVCNFIQDKPERFSKCVNKDVDKSLPYQGYEEPPTMEL